MRTLVAVHAHPDDESSKTAGTVAHYADLGVRCILVVATGGEEGDILNPAMEGLAEDLSEVRRKELEAAAGILGYADIIHLGYRDSGMPGSDANRHPEAFTNADETEAVGRLVEVLRRERPLVILGYDSHDHYPHPDHLRVHELALKAFRASSDPSKYAALGEPWKPARLFAPVMTRRRVEALHSAMIGRGLESPLGRWLDRIPVDHEPQADARIDITSTLRRARDALRAHATQVDPNGFWFQVPEEVVLATYPFEDYVLLDGDLPVHNNDLFAGLED